MRVIIDPDLCQGHLQCYSFAPHLFEVDHIGHAIAPDRELDGDDLERARGAVLRCPEGAIRIEP